MKYHFVFWALLEYALLNYASRLDTQRLAKKKVQKQWEIEGLMINLPLLLDLLFGQPLGVRPQNIVHKGVFKQSAKNKLHTHLYN